MGRGHRLLTSLVRSVPFAAGWCFSRGIGSGRRGVVSRCARGVLLAVVQPWAPCCVGQCTIPMDTWVDLGVTHQHEVVMSFFKKPAIGEGPKKGKKGELLLPEIPGAPTVAAFLSADTWPDGEVRERSSLVVFYEDGSWKVCLSEKNLQSTLWASCSSFGGLLEALEDRLTAESPDWRKQRQFKKKG